MHYFIGEFAKITGVTVRTLHYYDQKELLQPEKDPTTGHRRYTYEDLIQLQKITTFKFLGFSLQEIKELITQKDYRHSLRKQQELMQKKKEEINTILKSIDRIMAVYEEFGAVDENTIISSINDVQMKKEQMQWIEENLSESYPVMLDSISSEKEDELAKQTAGIYEKLKALSNKDPSDPTVQAVIAEFTFLLSQIVDVDILLNDVNTLLDDTNNSMPNNSDAFLFPNPLSETEQEFASAAFDIYLSKREGGE